MQLSAPCNKCETIHPIMNFYTQKKTNIVGDTYYYREKTCKECRKEDMKKRYKTKKAIHNFNDLQERTFFQRVKDLFAKWF